MDNNKKIIYADDLLLAIRDDHEINGQNYARMKMHINEAQTVDSVPVAYGQWILTHGEDGLYYDCSICGHCAGRGRKSNYCPNCGADMREGK